MKNEAQGYAEAAIPAAQAQADAAIQEAHGAAASDLAIAKGDADAFQALDRQYRANPVVVRERLYRDSVEHAIGQRGKVRWVPPPVGGSYHGFHITLSAPVAGPPRPRLCGWSCSDAAYHLIRASAAKQRSCPTWSG